MRYIPMGEARGPSLGYQPRPRPAPSTLAPLVRKVALIVLVFLLSGCGPGYERHRACRTEAGPEPYAAGHAFGLLGALAMQAQPEHQEWTARERACMERTENIR